MWDTEHNIAGTKEKNRMEHAHIENGRRSASKESTWRDPWREDKLRSTDEKMERRTGITGHRPKRREEEEEEEEEEEGGIRVFLLVNRLDIVPSVP